MPLYRFVAAAGPWIPFALFASGLVLCLCLFRLLRKGNQTLRELSDRRETIGNAAIEAIQTELEALKKSLKDAEERAGLLVAPTAPRSGFNISKRSLALRMSRLGEKPDNIASALSLPRREVDLLLKVQKIVITSSEQRA